MDKTSPAHLNKWWRHQYKVLSFHCALLHHVIGFLFSFGYITASKFPSLLQTADSRQVLQDFQITCMLKEGHAQVWSHAASIKEQFTWFPRMAAAVCRMSRHGFLRSPMWIWSERMKNRDLGDTDSSCFISRHGFIKVVNPRFALCQPSAGIFSPWQQLLSSSMAPNRNQPGPCFQTIPPSIPPYWLTWWMLAASITPNCWIWMRLIRSPSQMTFVFSVFWRWSSWKGW